MFGTTQRHSVTGAFRSGRIIPAALFAVQNASEDGPLIGLVFGLVGLYLHIEKPFFGSPGARGSQEPGSAKQQWPKVHLPEDRGSMTALDVLAVPAGPQRNKAIDDWCESVWKAFRDSRQTVIALLKECQII
jgi:hypothetical protein